jgi:hypothetical protein
MNGRRAEYHSAAARCLRNAAPRGHGAPGFRVTGESVSALQVRVRGRSWLLDSVGRDRLVARFDLRASHEGVNVIPTSGAALGLPPGVTWESTVPENLTVRLSRPDVPRGDQPRR